MILIDAKMPIDDICHHHDFFDVHLAKKNWKGCGGYFFMLNQNNFPPL
ncbi:hypothetical protein LINPERPRIM_LOCUS585 [Linum perenne]